MKNTFKWRTLLLALIVLFVMNMFMKSCKRSYLESEEGATAPPSVDATKKELAEYLLAKKQHIPKLRSNIVGRFKVITSDETTLEKVNEHIGKNNYDELVTILNSL